MAGVAEQRGRIALVASAVLVAVLAALVLPSHAARTHRLSNATALTDVTNAGAALQDLRANTNLEVTIVGPALLPGRMGARVSPGTTLFVKRSAEGHTYVRGSHTNGSVVYYLVNGKVYAQDMGTADE